MRSTMRACASRSWVHPSEIAYDFCQTKHTLEAIGRRLHLVRATTSGRTSIQRRCGLDGRDGRLASHLSFSYIHRSWGFVFVGHGDKSRDTVFHKLDTIGYAGPILPEWEDRGMDRELGTPQALGCLRKLNFDAPSSAFEGALDGRQPGMSNYE